MEIIYYLCYMKTWYDIKENIIFSKLSNIETYMYVGIVAELEKTFAYSTEYYSEKIELSLKQTCFINHDCGVGTFDDGVLYLDCSFEEYIYEKYNILNTDLRHIVSKFIFYKHNIRVTVA